MGEDECFKISSWLIMFAWILAVRTHVVGWQEMAISLLMGPFDNNTLRVLSGREL